MTKILDLHAICLDLPFSFSGFHQRPAPVVANVNAKMATDNERLKETNAKMVKFVPELASKYAKWPLHRERWAQVGETDDDGKPIFVPVAKQGTMKEDYVYCCLAPKDTGAGYYHLLHPVSYVNLFKRLESEAPPTGCCCGSAAVKNEYDEYDDVRTIVYNRSVASKPDDTQAAKDAIAKAQGVANKGYNVTQNMQLVLFAVT